MATARARHYPAKSSQVSSLANGWINNALRLYTISLTSTKSPAVPPPTNNPIFWSEGGFVQLPCCYGPCDAFVVIQLDTGPPASQPPRLARSSRQSGSLRRMNKISRHCSELICCQSPAYADPGSIWTLVSDSFEPANTDAPSRRILLHATPLSPLRDLSRRRNMTPTERADLPEGSAAKRATTQKSWMSIRLCLCTEGCILAAVACRAADKAPLSAPQHTTDWRLNTYPMLGTMDIHEHTWYQGFMGCHAAACLLCLAPSEV